VLFAPAPQNGIALRNETLVMPVQGRNAEGVPFSTIMSSKNRGRSWQVGNPTGMVTSECQAVELTDGRIMLNMRSSREARHMQRSVMVTSDLGITWTEHPTNHQGLIEPICNGSTIRIRYIQDGEAKTVLLFANPNSVERREKHTIKVSFDDGMSWPESHHYLLDNYTGFGYPSLVQIDDQHIGIVFEGSRSHIMFMKLTIEELVSGNLPK
jgi:sialidase-1